MPTPPRLNHLPGLPKSLKAHKFRPGNPYLKTVEDPDLLIEAMQDSLVSGLAELQGLNMPPLLQGDPTWRTMFSPVPGRCLWTFETLVKAPQVQDDPDLINLDPFLNLALKPSDGYPAALQGVTPRGALALTGMRVSELYDSLVFLADQDVIGARPGRSDCYTFLRPQGYGGSLDTKVDLAGLPYMPDDAYTPPRNSKRSEVQQFALVSSSARTSVEEDTDEEDLELKGFPATLLDRPPIDVDLGPDMHSLFLAAKGRLIQYAHRADNPTAALALKRDLSMHEPEAVDTFLHRRWDFGALWESRGTPGELITLALVRCMVQEAHKNSLWRYQQPHMALGISILSGISPAIFARAALEQYRRTGFAFLAENHIDAMAQKIASLPAARSAAAQSRRQDLIGELNDLTADYVALQDSLDPTLLNETYEAMTSGGFPAWGLGESLGESQDIDED